MADTSKLTLYANLLCPFARRGLITLTEKGLTAEIKYIPQTSELKLLEKWPLEIPKGFEGLNKRDLNEVKEEYKKNINPGGEVPSLVLSNGDIIVEADIVAEYLEDAFPASGNSLMPKDALQRSMIRHYLKVLGGPGGVSGMYGLVMNQNPENDQLVLDRVYGMWKTFAEMADKEGPYFLGKTFSLADVMLMPVYDQFRFVWKHYRAADLVPDDAEKFPWAPRVKAWAEAVQGRESFKTHSQGEEAYIKFYAYYASTRGVSEFGK